MLASVKIEDGMDFDDWVAAWIAKAQDRGHVLKTYDDEPGRVDMFVTNPNGHNGPGCVNCGWTECMHCDFKGDRIPVCTSQEK